MGRARVRVGVLSAGAWSESTHLPALASRPDVELVVVSRPDKELAEAAAGRFGAGHAETDWRAALDHELDAVIVSSPPSVHRQQVIGALRSGASVLVEKPFALTSADALAMTAAAVDNARSLLVAFGWSATPAFRTARELIRSGRLGRIEHVMMHLAVNTRRLLTGGDDGGWGGAGGSDPATYTDPDVSGGGTAAVSMSHQLGLLMWVLGERIDQVCAQTWPPAARVDLHDAVLASFSGGGSGVLSCVSTHPDSVVPMWHLAIHGEQGQIWIDTALGVVRYVGADGNRWEPSREEADGSYTADWPTNALVEVARGAAVPAGLSADLAVDVVRVTEAIYRSAGSGRPESV